MIPILYDKYEADFLSNGLGQLGDCLSCKVTEEINGIYEVEFTYPMTGAYYEQLINFGGVIACTHDHNGDIQLFDIYKYDAPIDGIVTFYASHVSYRLSNIYWFESGDWKRSPAEIFALWNNGTGIVSYSTIRDFTFTDYSDYTPFVNHSAYIPWSSLWDATRGKLATDEDVKRNPDSGSILEIWDGEWELDNFNLNFYRKRGQDRGVQIRFGKNMIGVEREKDWSSIVSFIYPKWMKYSIHWLYEPPVVSPNVEHDIAPWTTLNGGNVQQMYYGDEMLFLQPAILNGIMLDISEVFEGYPDEPGFKKRPLDADVRAYCQEYMRKNSTWRANDNITVEFLDLYDTPEYENIRGLSDCRVGDFVSILYPQLGIVSNGVEIMSLTYDVLAERVTQMQLNTIRTTLAQVIIDSMGGK